MRKAATLEEALEALLETETLDDSEQGEDPEEYTTQHFILSEADSDAGQWSDNESGGEKLHAALDFEDAREVMNPFLKHMPTLKPNQCRWNSFLNLMSKKVLKALTQESQRQQTAGAKCSS